MNRMMACALVTVFVAGPAWADDKCKFVGEAVNLLATIDRGCKNYRLTKKGKQAFEQQAVKLSRLPDALKCMETTKITSMAMLVNNYPKFKSLTDADDEAKYLSVVCDAAAHVLGDDFVKQVD